MTKKQVDPFPSSRRQWWLIHIIQYIAVQYQYCYFYFHLSAFIAPPKKQSISKVAYEWLVWWQVIPYKWDDTEHLIKSGKGYSDKYNIALAERA